MIGTRCDSPVYDRVLGASLVMAGPVVVSRNDEFFDAPPAKGGQANTMAPENTEYIGGLSQLGKQMRSSSCCLVCLFSLAPLAC